MLIMVSVVVVSKETFMSYMVVVTLFLKGNFILVSRMTVLMYRPTRGVQFALRTLTTCDVFVLFYDCRCASMCDPAL